VKQFHTYTNIPYHYNAFLELLLCRHIVEVI